MVKMDPHFDSITTMPSVALSGKELDNLELLLGGLYAPADGYCVPNNVPNGWPAEFLLAVPRSMAPQIAHKKALLLTDPDGTPLAHLAVDGTDSGMQDTDSIHVAGLLTALRPAEHPPCRDIRLTTPLAPPPVGKHGNLVAVFSTIPRARDVSAAIRAAEVNNCILWLIAVGGPQAHGSYSISGIVEELRAVSLNVPNSRIGLIVVPTFDPDEKLSRDKVNAQLLKNLDAVQVMDFSEPQTAARDTGHSADEGFQNQGTVVFLTGLSGSGKSTVARALAECLQHSSRRSISLLDGDEVRGILSPSLGFSREERDANIYRLGWVSTLVSSAGGIAICAPIAPFDAARQQVRHMAQRAGRFILVHISTPLAACEARDRKGLYAKARRGEILDFTGIGSPYEIPADADLHLDTSVVSVEQAVDQIMQLLSQSGVKVVATNAPQE